MKKHFNKPLIMTEENERDFQNSTRCYICGKQRYDKDGKDRDQFVIHKGKKFKIKNHPVRDHCILQVNIEGLLIIVATYNYD